MAELFLVREGDSPTPGGGRPFELDVLKQKLGLQPSDYHGPNPPKWKSPNKKFDQFREAKYVVVRIDPNKTKDNPDFISGYYFIRYVSAHDAKTTLGI